MATTVQYGRVILYNVVTRDWDEEVIYDQSGTDVIGTKIKMRFAGYIHAQEVGIGGVSRTHIKKRDDDPNNLVEAYDAVKAELEEARKTLIITVGQNTIPGSTLVPGREIFRCEPPDADKRSNVYRDIDNGPKPRGLHITRVVNDQILAAEWACECMKLHCDSNRGPSLVLNNRWSISEETDANWFTSRSIRGRMRLSASNYDPASAFRHIVTPGLEAGFRRERIEYAVSENGLEVEYQVTDRQIHDAAPSPATKMAGSFTSSTNDGVTFVSAVRVRLEGPPHADKRLLISRCLQIVDNRLNFQVKRKGAKCIIESASIADVIGDENAVEVAMTIREVPGDTGDLLTGLRVDMLGQPLKLRGYNATQSVAPALYGYDPYGDARKPAYLFLLHCYLQSPCDADHEIRGFPNIPAANSEGQGQKETQIIPRAKSQLLITKNAAWNDSHKGANGFEYTFCRAETKYTVKRCRAQLPVAATVNEQSASSADTCVFIDLAPGIATREITVDAERIGSPPQIPAALDSYTDGGIRGKLLFHDVVALPSSLSGDGQTRVYRVRAFYRWGLNRLPRANEKLKVGILPFTSFSQDDNKLDGNKIYSTTLGP